MPSVLFLQFSSRLCIQFKSFCCTFLPALRLRQKRDLSRTHGFPSFTEYTRLEEACRVRKCSWGLFTLIVIWWSVYSTPTMIHDDFVWLWCFARCLRNGLRPYSRLVCLLMSALDFDLLLHGIFFICVGFVCHRIKESGPNCDVSVHWRGCCERSHTSFQSFISQNVCPSSPYCDVIAPLLALQAAGDDAANFCTYSRLSLCVIARPARGCWES